MASKRTTISSIPQRPVHSIQEKRCDIERLKKRIYELEDFDPSIVKERFKSPELKALETAIDDTLTAVFGHRTVEYNRYHWATQLDHGPVKMGRNSTLLGGRGGYFDDGAEARKYIAEGKAEAISLLKQAVRGLEEEIEYDVPASKDYRAEPLLSLSSKVFVVHGHDEASKESVARFLEKLELEAIILQEQPDQGFTIIEKFERHADQVGFAVVLLTPDDIGGLAKGVPQGSRARQNVIFELGYFVAKLGRGKTCLLRKGEIEIPSDLYGVIYSDMDAAEGWKIKLVKELKAAGMKFDANKVWE